MTPSALFHLLIFGPAGSGCTTLGKLLSAQLNIPLLDTDDFYWKPTEPPYREKFPENERVENLTGAIKEAGSTVISGSVSSWGKEIHCLITHAVYLYLEPKERTARLIARERERFGQRILPGGDMISSCFQLLDPSTAERVGGHATLYPK